MAATRVLLVDNDQKVHTLTEQALDRADGNFEIERVSSYPRGLNAVQDAKHDVYLVADQLDDHSGIELLTTAAEYGNTAPIVMLTTNREAELEALRAGAATYIRRSALSAEAIQQAIQDALERTQFKQAYRSLLTKAYEGIIITRDNGKIIFTNEKFSEMLGYDTASLSNMDLFNIMGRMDRRIDFPSAGEGVLLTRQVRCANGEVMNVELSVKRIDGDQILFVFRDLADRDASLEERERYIQQLRVLHQVDAELSQVLNIEYVLSLALDAAVRLSGADSGFIGLMDNRKVKVEQAIGHYASTQQGDYLPEHPLIERLIDDTEPRLIQNVDEEPEYTPINEKTRAQMLLPMLSYERLVGIVNLETSKPERFTEETFNFIKLITARVAVAVENAQLYRIAQEQLAELQELYSQVSELEQLKTDMIRIAAHDLRNPVSVILGYSELLRRTAEEVLTEKQQGFLQMIERASRRMEKITTDILSLERIENLQTSQGEMINLSDLVREIYHEFEGQADEKSQDFRLELENDNLQVQAESAQLREAIANLISNAIKYTPDHGTITVALTGENGDTVFKVVDSGYGIPEEQQANLFQPFFRAQSKETTTIDGTGLGLYLIKNIIKRYNGQILFDSVYGEGSTFGFKLPGYKVGDVT